MGSEPVEELPDDLEAWVSERAAASDVPRADVVRRLMAAHQLLDENPDWLDDGDQSALGSDATGSTVTSEEIDALEAQMEELAGRVGELETDLDEKISDVRRRVIQVKRETDAKAPADHDHPAIERRMDEGFENYEEILEYLTERTDALEDGAKDRSDKLRTVANAVVDLRKRVSALEGEIEKRAAAAELRETANRHGISKAACGACGESVQLGLLDEPVCPHCESPFDGVEDSGWFRSNRLTVGDRPALESAPATAVPDGPSGPPESSDSRPGGHEKSGSAPSDAAGDKTTEMYGGVEADPEEDGFAGEPPEEDGDTDGDGAEVASEQDDDMDAEADETNSDAAGDEEAGDR